MTSGSPRALQAAAAALMVVALVFLFATGAKFVRAWPKGPRVVQLAWLGSTNVQAGDVIGDGTEEFPFLTVHSQDPFAPEAGEVAFLLLVNGTANRAGFEFEAFELRDDGGWVNGVYPERSFGGELAAGRSRVLAVSVPSTNEWRLRLVVEERARGLKAWFDTLTTRLGGKVIYPSREYRVHSPILKGLVPAEDHEATRGEAAP